MLGARINFCLQTWRKPTRSLRFGDFHFSFSILSLRRTFTFWSDKEKHFFDFFNHNFFHENFENDLRFFFQNFRCPFSSCFIPRFFQRKIIFWFFSTTIFSWKFWNELRFFFQKTSDVLFWGVLFSWFSNFLIYEKCFPKFVVTHGGGAAPRKSHKAETFQQIFKRCWNFSNFSEKVFFKYCKRGCWISFPGMKFLAVLFEFKKNILNVLEKIQRRSFESTALISNVFVSSLFFSKELKADFDAVTGREADALLTVQRLKRQLADWKAKVRWLFLFLFLMCLQREEVQKRIFLVHFLTFMSLISSNFFFMLRNEKFFDYSSPMMNSARNPQFQLSTPRCRTSPGSNFPSPLGAELRASISRTICANTSGRRVSWSRGLHRRRRKGSGCVKTFVSLRLVCGVWGSPLWFENSKKAAFERADFFQKRFSKKFNFFRIVQKNIFSKKRFK